MPGDVYTKACLKMFSARCAFRFVGMIFRRALSAPAAGRRLCRAANRTISMYSRNLSAPAFAADFPPDAPKFNQRTLHVRLINLCTSDKKSSHKIRRSEIPRVHENEKEETNLKEDFIASLTHDLKVPIIAQDNTFDLLLNEKFGTLTDIQKEALIKLKISNMDLKYLVEALLETYKVEHKGIIINKEKDILINSFIKDVIAQLSSIFELHNKKIDFKTELNDNFTANIDIFLTKRVINNLILNALSYSTNSDTIDVLLKGTKESFLISTKDYGIGIEKEDIDKIFNKFYSGKSNLRQASTGLGLYLSNKIIKALGGKIEVESILNQGSTFTITLPSE